jgi:ATP-dependent Lon protease
MIINIKYITKVMADPPKKEMKYNLRSKKKQNYKCNNDSDDSDSDYLPVEDEESSEEIEVEEQWDRDGYKDFLCKMFPSKYMKEKCKRITPKRKHKKKREKRCEKRCEKKREKKGEKKGEKKYKKKHGKKIKNTEKTVIESDADEEELLANYFQEEEEFDDDELQSMLQKNTKFNIIFTLGGQEELTEEHSSEEESEIDEDEIKKAPKWKRGDNVQVKKSDWEDWYKGTIITVHKNGTYKVKFDDLDAWDKIKEKYIKNIDEEEKILEEVQLLIKEKKKGKSHLMKKFKQMADTLQKRSESGKKQSDKNMKSENCKDFRTLLKEKTIQNDFRYFKNLTREKQEKIIEELRKIREYTQTDKPYRLTIIESEIPIQYKSTALRKLESLTYMDPGSGEYYKLKLWVDTFMRIPFGKYHKLPVTIDSGREICNRFMENAKNVLDKSVYGLEDAKMQIMQVLGQLITNPNSIGTAIAIKGPPGTGKTTLIKEGVSKILDRPFAFLALGGATDSSFLEGHSYTYEGSVWGKVVDILIQAKTMNPIIYFDELDKISDTPKGEEITGILTHLTDTTQNDKFHDKYFSNIDFNLNKVLFIFSYNDEKRVNPILKDRMYRIETKGYDKKEKIMIAKDFLIPKIEKNVNFEKKQIIISDESIGHIIDHYTENEKGVRNLKRGLEIVFTKLNLYRLMKPDSSLFEKEKVLKVSFPFNVQKDTIDKLIKNNDNSNVPFGMYM